MVWGFLGYYQPNSNELKPGLYRYDYVSVYIQGNSVTHGDWRKPSKMKPLENVAFRIIDHNTIYKGYGNSKGAYRWGDTLIRVSDSALLAYRPVPTKVLDFDLVGVYYFDRRFTDSFSVIYYSKKRNSFIEQTHIYALNRIVSICMYMNEPYHPFYDIDKYFKIPKGKDTIYYGPTQKLKLN